MVGCFDRKAQFWCICKEIFTNSYVDYFVNKNGESLMLEGRSRG